MIKTSQVSPKIVTQAIQQGNPSELLELEQTENNVPENKSTSETITVKVVNSATNKKIDGDIAEVCRIVEEIENSWTDFLSPDDFEKRLLLDGDCTTWSTSLSDRLSMNSFT